MIRAAIPVLLGLGLILAIVAGHVRAVEVRAYDEGFDAAVEACRGTQ